MALFNIWHDLLDTCVLECNGDPDELNRANMIQVSEQRLERLQEMGREAESLVALGESYNLWSWRNPWLLQWKRGIPGAEFGTIFVLLQGLAKELEQSGGMAAIPTPQTIDEQFDKLVDLWRLFHNKGRDLLKEEARELDARTTKGGMELSTQVRVLRTEMFNCVQCYGIRSYGGLYRQLLDQIDFLLLGALLADPGRS